MARYAPALVLTLCAGACACTVGPDFKPPVPPAASGYTRQAPADTAAIAVAGGTGQHF